MVLSILVVCAVLCFLYYLFTRKFNYWQSRNVKGPKPIPIFGNFKEVALRKKHMGVFYRDMYNQYPEEKVVGLYRMTSPTLLIRDLDIAKQVLIKDFESFPDRGSYFSKEGLGENIFHCDAETWKLMRHRFTSVFTNVKFKAIITQLVDHGDKFAHYVEEITLKQPEQDIYQNILKYTVGSTMISAFGMHVDTFSKNKHFFEIIDDKFTTSYWNEMDMTFPGFLKKFNLSLISDEAVKFCHQIVEAGIKNQWLSNKTGLYNAMDVIRLLKKEGDAAENAGKILNNETQQVANVTADLLAAQAWIFYTAGYANNTLALTYALYYLAQYPDVQNKLYDEISEVMAKYDNILTYEILTEMKYLNMVCEETLRMHPLTNGLIRSVSQEIKIEGMDLTIDEETVVVVSPYAIQRDEKYYPEPDRFNPDRFLPENVKNRHSCAFLPFGTGRRSCIGSKLAKIQFGICIVKLLAKFRVETSINSVSSIDYDPWRMLLTPKSRIYLNLMPRQTS